MHEIKKILWEGQDTYNGLYFDEQYMAEKFQYLTRYDTKRGFWIPVYDVKHAMERLEERFKGKITWPTIEKLIKNAMAKIESKYNLAPNHYMAYHKVLDVKVPLDLRPDEYNKKKLIVAVPTILKKSEHDRDVKEDIKIIAEKIMKKPFTTNSLQEAVTELEKETKGCFFSVPEPELTHYVHYFENGEYYKSFVDIELD